MNQERTAAIALAIAPAPAINTATPECAPPRSAATHSAMAPRTAVPVPQTAGTAAATMNVTMGRTAAPVQETVHAQGASTAAWEPALPPAAGRMDVKQEKIALLALLTVTARRVSTVRMARALITAATASVTMGKHARHVQQTVVLAAATLRVTPTRTVRPASPTVPAQEASTARAKPAPLPVSHRSAGTCLAKQERTAAPVPWTALAPAARVSMDPARREPAAI